MLKKEKGLVRPLLNNAHNGVFVCKLEAVWAGQGVGGWPASSFRAHTPLYNISKSGKVLCCKRIFVNLRRWYVKLYRHPVVNTGRGMSVAPGWRVIDPRH